MKYDLKRPCKGCPFLRGEDGPVRLYRERTKEIAENAIGNPGAMFACHATVDYEVEGDDEDWAEAHRARSGDYSHCAGAVIFSLRLKKPNQSTRMAIALKLLDVGSLDLKSNVFESKAEMLRASLPSRFPRKR